MKEIIDKNPIIEKEGVQEYTVVYATGGIAEEPLSYRISITIPISTLKEIGKMQEAHENITIGSILKGVPIDQENQTESSMFYLVTDIDIPNRIILVMQIPEPATVRSRDELKENVSGEFTIKTL